MAKSDLTAALKNDRAMNAYIEIRDGAEIIADVRAYAEAANMKRFDAACAAMQGMMHTPLWDNLLHQWERPTGNITRPVAVIAELAFVLADALIKEENK